MPLKKSSRKILLRIAVAMIPLAILFSGLVYAKLYGFKRALSELVHSKTDGMYTLNIGHSSIDILALTFTLDDVKIIRSPNAPSKGILGVTIPYMQLKFGSIASMSMVKQFDIKKLIIDEPIIEIDAQQQQRNSTTRISTSNLSYQVVKLYPAIESLLGRFDIESLSIRRATVGMKNVARTSVRLNLVDLLVEHWNIQKLTTESQIQLKVGAQALVFPKAALNFSGIEFNFRQHHLQFSDFNFTSLDTVSQSRVEVSGKSLLLQRLDYKDLYENQRYAIKRATIDQPHVIAEFKLKKDTTRMKDRDLLTRILKQAIGECSIDSTVVRDARIHLVVQKDKDSVKIDLPHVNVNVYAFKVIRDSSAFQVGGLEVGLDRTAIALRRNLSFNCNTILFDKYRDLTLTDVVLYDSASRKNIAQCGKLKLKYFNLLDFAFDKKFQADELSIEDADVNLTPERIKRKESSKDVDDRIDNVNVRLLSFKNVTVHYADADRSLRVNNLSLTVNNLKTRTTGDFEYAVGDIRFGNALIRNASGTLVSKMKGVDFDGRLLRAAEVDVQKDSLHLHAKQIMALKEGEEPVQKNFKHWRAIHFNTLEVTGWLPARAGKKEDREPKDNLFETVERLSVGTALINIHRDKKYIVCSGKDLEIEKMVSENGKVKFDSIRGQLSNVNVQLKTLSIQARQMAINYPARFQVLNLQLQKNDLEISTPALDLNNLVRDEDFWSIGKLKASKIEISKAGKVYFTSDVVMMNNAEIAKDEPPSIKRLEVYNPLLILPETNAKRKSSDHERTSSFVIVHHFIIHPGQLQWKNNQQLTFGKMEGDTRNGTFRCASLKTETEKSSIQVYDVVLRNNKINIDSVHIGPRKEWVYTNTVENDLIDARFQGVVLHSFSINDVIEHRLLKNADISVEQFSFDIKRDKRMPDPPMVEKPVTLEGLLKLPPAITVNRIDLKNGRIQYTETSEKTGEDGIVVFENIAANIKVGKTRSEPPLVMVATARLYNEGSLHVTYETLDTSSFKLNVRLKDFNLTALNRVVVPLQAIHIKSGYLKKFDLQLTANADQASGASVISYNNLHLEIRKHGDSEKKRWGNEVLTFLADGILKNSKENATTVINQPRIRHKAIFNYWVKSATQGAIGGVLRGKHRKIRA
jgi:hypothetical protein